MSQAVSPVTGVEALAAVKPLVLDSVSSPLTRVMYARALEDFFGWLTGQFTLRRCAGLAGGPRSERACAGKHQPEALSGAEAGGGSRL